MKQLPALLLLVAIPFLSAAAATQPADLRDLQRIEAQLIPASRPWRHPDRKFSAQLPRYITVHATDNPAPTADALAHARLLASPEGLRSASPQSRTGYVSWHFTVDDTRIVQHLPVDEQGDHADFAGPGNQCSIGIEICVNRGGDLPRATRRAAALVARLMKEQGITIDRVVPHYHWPQAPTGFQKPCPAFLMDNGKPGRKWLEFLLQVQTFRDAME